MTANIFCSLPAAISSRPFGEEEFENLYLDMQRVYLVTLAKETESPLGAEERRSRQREDKKDKGGEEKKGRRRGQEDRDKEAKKPVAVKVDPTASRIGSWAWKSRPAEYSDLRLVDGRVFYLRHTVADDADGWR